MNELQELVKVTMEELKATLVYFGEERGTKSSDFFNMIGSLQRILRYSVLLMKEIVCRISCVWYWFVCVLLIF